MNEQRQEAYFILIQSLLNCLSGEEAQILSANYDLIDVGLLQAMDTVVAVFSQRKSEKAAARANRLINLSNQIAEVLKIPQSPETQGETETLDAYAEFLQKVLQVTVESNFDEQVVYSLLTNNIDKLDEVLAEKLCQWRNGITEVGTSEEKYLLAISICVFSDLIVEFPFGNKACNIEIAIAGYEIALTVFTHEAFPEYWALAQNNLGNAYRERIAGDKANNIEQSIACSQAALTFLTREAFPYEWALTGTNAK
jgi:hypothetical protein